MCGKDFIRKNYSRKTCSAACSSNLRAFYVLGKKNKWSLPDDKKVENITYPQHFRNKTRKDLIRQRDNYRCAICKKPPTGGKALSIHHIDWDKRNSSLDNLISLCGSCHSIGHHRSTRKPFDNNKLVSLATNRTKRMPKGWKAQMASLEGRYTATGH